MTTALKQQIGAPRRLSVVDDNRKKISQATTREKKSSLGQFMTPAGIATFMASLLPAATGPVRLLDAGAGIGSLSSAVLDRQLHGDLNAPSLHATAFEIDLALIPHLTETLVHFRTFNGHTQVNATDLKMLPYPDLATLLDMGKWAEKQNRLTQEAIDRCVEGFS